MLQCSRRITRRSSTVRLLSTRPSDASDLDPKRFQTKLKTKLNYFVETGQVLKKLPQETSRSKWSTNTKKPMSLDKMLLKLIEKYDAHKFAQVNGREFQLHSLKPSDLRTDSKKSLQIFNNLMQFKKISKSPIPTQIAHTLLGVTLEQLKDEFVVTKSTVNLLLRDESTERAEYLARLAGNNGVVAMNAILQWLLERGEVKLAFKNIHDRKKWNIPPNAQTYTMLFDGIAKAHEWGKLSRETCEKCIAIFEQQHATYEEAAKSSKSKKDKISDPRVQIEQFNACLNVLVKNFDDNQLIAWKFFDNILPEPNSNSNLLKIIPDCHTFTTLLNGARKHAFSKAEKITADRNKPISEKTIQLLEVQAQLIQTAQMVLEKVMQAATPPVPPTREESDKNPALLFEYRAKMRRQLVDIDPAFVSVFTSCFVNNIGTGLDLKLGSHYKYIEQGLQYLKIWDASINQLYDFLQQTSGVSDVTLATKSMKYNTDTRLNKYLQEEGATLVLKSSSGATSIQDIVPETILTNEVTQSKFNPKVIFPPSPFSKNKTRAIFSGKEKPLVDFTRPTYAEIRALVLDKQYHDSRGKYGKKLPSNSTASAQRKQPQINRFLLQLIFDGLLKQGRNNEFVMAIWYVLTRYGNIRIVTETSEDMPQQRLFPKTEENDLANAMKGKDISRGFLPEVNFPALEDECKMVKGKYQTKSESVDIQLVHTMFYKLNENFRKLGRSSINVIVEIFSSLVNTKTNPEGSITATDTTTDIIFSSIVSDLHYYNDYNYNTLVKEKKRSKIPNNSPKKSISHEQLNIVVPALTRFVVSLIKYQTSSKNSPFLLNNNIDSYNKIIERIYKSTWIDVSDEQELHHHKQIIKSGIAFYRPKVLIEPNDTGKYSSTILPSIEYVYNKLKSEESDNDSRLTNGLRSLLQIKSRDKLDEERLHSLTSSIFRAL